MCYSHHGYIGKVGSKPDRVTRHLWRTGASEKSLNYLDGRSNRLDVRADRLYKLKLNRKIKIHRKMTIRVYLKKLIAVTRKRKQFP